MYWLYAEGARLTFLATLAVFLPTDFAAVTVFLELVSSSFIA